MLRRTRKATVIRQSHDFPMLGGEDGAYFPPLVPRSCNLASTVVTGCIIFIAFLLFISIVVKPMQASLSVASESSVHSIGWHIHARFDDDGECSAILILGISN